MPHSYTSLITGKIGPVRGAATLILNLDGDSTFIIQRDAWNEWDATQEYSTSTLPSIIGSLGGLWSAFSGVLAMIFGTSLAFVIFGKVIQVVPSYIHC
jgi:hypothetical protein